jgi:hypothetical protein
MPPLPAGKTAFEIRSIEQMDSIVYVGLCVPSVLDA